MARIPSLSLLALLFAALAACSTPVEQRSADELFWRFDRLDRVGGSATHVEGQPRLVDTGAGRAIAFDGVDDALFVGRHPLAGARAFTMEAVFRPDGGAFEQRWLHLAEVPGGHSGGDFTAAPPSGPRFLFEIRVTGKGWYLDTFVAGPGYNKALIFPEKLHPIGRWYHVAQTYDGRVYRSYVNGELQGEAEIAFQPQGAGYASVGTRIDRRSYFQGAVFSARFLPRALAPAHFMRVPARLAD